jgi:hypothetical protein
MSDNSKYYYLKLKDSFYDLPAIKAIESHQNGYEYICIMQKMYLRSLSRDGKLMLTDTIPYELPTLSHVLGHKQETIKSVICCNEKINMTTLNWDNPFFHTRSVKKRPTKTNRAFFTGGVKG